MLACVLRGLSVPRGFPSKIPWCLAFEFPLLWRGRINCYTPEPILLGCLYLTSGGVGRRALPLCSHQNVTRCYRVEMKVRRNRCLERVKSLFFKSKSLCRTPANYSVSSGTCLSPVFAKIKTTQPTSKAERRAASPSTV